MDQNKGFLPVPYSKVFGLYLGDCPELDDEVPLPDAGLVRGAAVDHHHDPGEGGAGLLLRPRLGAVLVHGCLPGLAVETVKTLLDPL